MNLIIPGIIALTVATANNGWGRNQYPTEQNIPLYRVTVIERTVKAVNYQYRGGPTQIDFRGTVLLPEAKGDATVESKAGRTEIDARFDRLLAPTRYGHEYLTYVLWAITPEGHAKNLGEVLPGSSDKAKIHVTSDLQAFGLIVTAEPYSAVRQPSDVVVMENQIRPDTIGKIEPIQVKYSLLPRGEYTYNVPADLVAAEGNGPLVSMNTYEEMLEVYQAQNAVQIARAMGAAQYAADTFARAEDLLRNAQDMQIKHFDRSRVIGEAREAAQTAEDARAITLKHQQDAEVADATLKAENERQRRQVAEAQAQAALAQASADRASLDQERIGRQEAEAQAQAAQAQASADRVMLQQQAQTQAVAPAEIPAPEPPRDNRKRDLRMSLYRQLGASALQVMDTPRGLVVTIPAADFTNRTLQPFAAGRVAQVAAAIAANPGLSVDVDDNFDGGSAERADAVRAALIGGGIAASAISVRSVGNSRPIASTTTVEGRELNRRVEIAISGDAIGNMPYWDRTYSVTPH